MARRSKYAFDLKLAIGVPAGTRSQLWRLIVKPGKSDPYLLPESGGHGKITLHDPALSRGGAPWHFTLSGKRAEELGLPPDLMK